MQNKNTVMTDEELCANAQRGDSEAERELAERYSRVVRVCARPYFLEGGDMEDLIQEGMFGLVKAMRDYSPVGDASFSTYAQACIKNRIYSAIRTALRKKHTPLNESVSFEGEELKNAAAGEGNPEDAVISSEKLKEFKTSLDRILSQFEQDVLKLYREGWSYEEIGEQLGRSSKAVDNAVQRIRRKTVRHITKA